MRVESRAANEDAIGLVITLLLLFLLTRYALFVVIAVVLLLGLLVKPVPVHQIAKVWKRITQGLLTGLSKAGLALVFFVFLVPYSYLYRLAKKDVIRAFFFGSRSDSSFITREKAFQSADFERTW